MSLILKEFRIVSPISRGQLDAIQGELYFWVMMNGDVFYQILKNQNLVRIYNPDRLRTPSRLKHLEGRSLFHGVQTKRGKVVGYWFKQDNGRFRFFSSKNILTNPRNTA